MAATRSPRLTTCAIVLSASTNGDAVRNGSTALRSSSGASESVRMDRRLSLTSDTGGEIERHGHATAPPGVVEQARGPARDEARGRDAAVVERAERPEVDDRLRLERRECRAFTHGEHGSADSCSSIAVAQTQIEGELVVSERLDDRQRRVCGRPVGARCVEWDLTKPLPAALP